MKGHFWDFLVLFLFEKCPVDAFFRTFSALNIFSNQWINKSTENAYLNYPHCTVYAIFAWINYEVNKCSKQAFHLPLDFCCETGKYPSIQPNTQNVYWIIINDKTVMIKWRTWNFASSKLKMKNHLQINNSFVHIRFIGVV